MPRARKVLPTVVLRHLRSPKLRVHLPGRLREALSGLHEGLKVGEHGWPTCGCRLVFSLVGQVFVHHGEPDDLTVGFDVFPWPSKPIESGGQGVSNLGRRKVPTAPRVLAATEF